jgi:hypothetical protein
VVRKNRYSSSSSSSYFSVSSGSSSNSNDDSAIDQSDSDDPSNDATYVDSDKEEEEVKESSEKANLSSSNKLLELVTSDVDAYAVDDKTWFKSSLTVTQEEIQLVKDAWFRQIAFIDGETYTEITKKSVLHLFRLQYCAPLLISLTVKDVRQFEQDSMQLAHIVCKLHQQFASTCLLPQYNLFATAENAFTSDYQQKENCVSLQHKMSKKLRIG